jgi:hypothetical protein
MVADGIPCLGVGNRLSSSMLGKRAQLTVVVDAPSRQASTAAGGEYATALTAASWRYV